MVNENRLLNEFIKLASFDSESFHEKQIAHYLENKLVELGFLVSVDNAGNLLSNNSDSAGNIYAYLQGNINAEPILLSAHMDTVAPGIGKKVIINPDGKITSNGTTVLGSDDISGIVTILEAVSVIIENNLPHPDIEIVFYVAEEPFCQGSRVFDYSKIKSKNAYVFDLSGNVGIIANQAPSIISITAEIQGKSAHSGFEPENGINAITIAANALSKIKVGRIDNDTTANFGKIIGGTGRNIIPNSVNIEGEIRSLSSDKALALAEEFKQIFISEANKLNGSVIFSYKEEIRAYNVSTDSFVITNYKNALKAVSNEDPTIITTFGGSDNNNLNKHGITGIVVSNAMNAVHTINEYFYKEELIKSAEIAVNLIKID